MNFSKNRNRFISSFSSMKNSKYWCLNPMWNSLFSLPISFSEKCWERSFKVPNISCNRSNWDRFLSIVSHLEAWRSIIWRWWFPLYLSDFALITSWENAESTNLTAIFLICVGAVWLERWVLLMKV